MDPAMTLDFRYYFDLACDGMIVFDASRRVRLANDAFAALVGEQAEALVGRHFEELTEQSDRPAHSSPVQELATFGSVVTMYRVRPVHGEPIDVEISSTLLEDGGTFSVVRDTRRRSEFGAPRSSGGWLAQRTSGPRMRVTEPFTVARDVRLLFDAIPLPTWVYDAETLRFIAVNRAAVEHYGYAEEEFLANTILFIRTSDDAPSLLDRSHDRPGDDRGAAIRHRRKDAEPIDVETISYDFELDGRRVRIVVVNDVTEQLRTRDQREQLQAQMLLAQKMDAVGRLAGGVAHDFNNLLSVILGAVETLGKGLASYDPLQEEVTDIRDAVGRGAALTRQLLIFGRKEVRTPGLLDVNEVVRGVERLLMRVLGSSVKIELRCGVEHAPVVADASQLEQVLVNLSINARDAMLRGGTLTIRTGETTLDLAAATVLDVIPGPYVTIDVEDTGVGMDEATCNRAFEPFFTTKGSAQGAGLGLAMVYGIVRQSGGAISLQSAPDAGTRVRIHLPRGDAGAAPALARAAIDESRGLVLLVEDEPRVRSQARRLLQRSGYEVVEASDGAEGKHIFAERHGDVDVVVTDVMMPLLGGVEMVATLRAIQSDLPVVFVSGYTAEEQDLPLDDRTAFLTKPYTIDALCDAIAAVVPS
ncbi:MAG: hybrid sensor histidine kinase/response regulator [Gemmatimonadetes bacterium]|nr:MAG: hybrid sensor histidine kinase/response regulator [Gemmatimonadota bacterium]